MARTVLITGATGFLGRNLLDRLLQVSPDDTYLLLVRSHAAERRIRRRYPLMEDDQLRIVYGDLRDDRLGLSSSDRRRLCRTVDEIWHVAGSTSFHRSDAALLRETNVNGTRYLIDLAQQCRHGPPIYFVSTFYVCGITAGSVEEDGLPPCGRFRNAYERTKWEAEKVLRVWRGPFVVFRPSIVLGHSQTLDPQGERRMMYGYLLGVACGVHKHLKTHGQSLWAHLQRPEASPLRVSLRMIGNNQTRKNFVCVDDVVRILVAVARRAGPAALGRTFHIVNPKTMVGTAIGRALERALNVKGIRYVGDRVERPSELERSVLRWTRPFVPYTIHSDPPASMENAEQLLGRDAQVARMTAERFTRMLRSFVERELIRRDGRVFHA
ncbi:MAG: NAD-dependent epimerase/dehydratase family protein [Planctomycetes bacterium]|nr:NAD-dependent epimerase/dehydratase family protein [Planctomycetota bacterium]